MLKINAAIHILKFLSLMTEFSLGTKTKQTFVPGGVESHILRCWRDGQSEWMPLPPFLHPAQLLAFHPATWAALVWSGSYYISGLLAGNHLLKTDFRKQCTLYKSTRQNAHHSRHSIHYTSKFICKARAYVYNRTGGSCRQTLYTVTHSVCSGKTYTR